MISNKHVIILALATLLYATASITALASADDHTQLTNNITQTNGSLKLIDTDQVTTVGSININNKTFSFSAGQTDNELGGTLVKLVFGFSGREITLEANSSTEEVNVSANTLAIDANDISAYKNTANEIEIGLAPELKELAHNSMLIGMMKYFARAPVGFEPTPRQPLEGN